MPRTKFTREELVKIAVDATLHHSERYPVALKARTMLGELDNEQPSQEALAELVRCLREGLSVLVREGLITEDRAKERANNLAMCVMGSFELELIDDS